MEEALINLFNLVNSELITPIASSLSQTNIFNNVLNLLCNVINAFFRLFNNDNLIVIENTSAITIISELLALLFLIFSFVILFNMFAYIINSIRNNFVIHQDKWKGRKRK